MEVLPVQARREISRALSGELPRYFTKPEVELILEQVREKPRDHLLINFLWQTGARVSEALGVRIKDIDFFGKSVRIRTLKQKKERERVVPLKDHLLGQIGVYAAQRGLGREDRLFDISRQRAYQIVRDAVLKAGFDRERAHPHTFRHSFAVHCVFSGVPILVIKEWLGHRDIQKTLIYMKVLSRDTRHFHDQVEF